LILLGCGGPQGPQREHIFGEVSLDGKLLDSGRIRFLPVDKKGLTGSAGVKAGQFEIPEAEGLPAGVYRVEIEGDPDLGFPIDDDVEFAKRGGKPLPPPPVPAKFNTKSTLKATVVAGQPNEINFPLSTKDSPERDSP
jgi:hypothetical protein